MFQSSVVFTLSVPGYSGWDIRLPLFPCQTILARMDRPGFLAGLSRLGGFSRGVLVILLGKNWRSRLAASPPRRLARLLEAEGIPADYTGVDGDARLLAPLPA